MAQKTRVYKEGDAMGRLVYEPHGRRKYGWGHCGHEFGYILYVYKAKQEGYVMAMSLPSRVYIAYVKAIVKAVAETPMPQHKVFGNSSWLKGKTWRHPQGGEYPILKEERQ